MSDKRVDLEIARLIGQPINPNLPSPLALTEACNVEAAAPGEEIKAFTGDTSDIDDIYTADADGKLTIHKCTPVTPAAVTWVGLQSLLEYVLINDVLPSEDQGALARKKAGITRAMDKQEVKLVCDAALGVVSQRVTAEAGKDVLHRIIQLKQKVGVYGDNFVLLVGTDIADAIDTYDIDYVTTHEYKIGIKDVLANLGITVIKIVGEVNGAVILGAKKGILVARNSMLAEGRPIYFLRRSISPEIAAQMGIESGVRLISVAQVPTIIDTKNTLGYGCFGYESFMLVITNYRAIATMVDLLAA
jgi:hypothetical protein